MKEDHLGAEEGVVGARPLEHHNSLVGLAHLVGSRDFQLSVEEEEEEG